mmetsp:Transcript_9452/g.30862  ORF Transcript_9452/g.30862 Transcript_9452/m.30862 type:complete len:345 (+) Transcript_9452:1884-2918(+)
MVLRWPRRRLMTTLASREGGLTRRRARRASRDRAALSSTHSKPRWSVVSLLRQPRQGQSAFGRSRAQSARSVVSTRSTTSSLNRRVSSAEAARKRATTAPRLRVRPRQSSHGEDAASPVDTITRKAAAMPESPERASRDSDVARRRNDFRTTPAVAQRGRPRQRAFANFDASTGTVADVAARLFLEEERTLPNTDRVSAPGSSWAFCSSSSDVSMSAAASKESPLLLSSAAAAAARWCCFFPSEPEEATTTAFGRATTIDAAASREVSEAACSRMRYRKSSLSSQASSLSSQGPFPSFGKKSTSKFAVVTRRVAMGFKVSALAFKSLARSPLVSQRPSSATWRA